MPVPGTRRRVGLDAGLSLIPGVGEVIGAILSAWIIFGALRHRVPLRRVVRMVVNVLIDTVFGSIPVLGTIFDWLFEENVMNIQALLRYRDRTRPPRSLRAVFGAAALVTIVILGTALAAVAALAAAVVWIANQR